MKFKDTATFTNGVEIPRLGFGVWQAKDGQQAYEAVTHALKSGYTSIDTAAAYKNEESVGRAIKDSNLPREELFITTKVWNADQGYESTLKAFDESLKKLQLEYIDLYLIHWPVADKYSDTWRALENLYETGKVRAIGVCNFHEHHLTELFKTAKIKPMINQIELHPKLSQEPLRAFCEKHQIIVEAWSPLGNGKILTDSTIAEIAKAHEKSPAQIILRWDLQHGIVTIPKSVNADRIAENTQLFDFELSAAEMAKIDALNEDHRTGPDPDNFNF
ncbi:glyoxal reductase [Brochothrix thermosphacta]|uniref:aldo/keto reductase n=1 Tax=Brochothrix thermosphacta TaxID=2756 RepID=UPI000E71310C|nr:aldo/keto reductase [Brochothrix thermosphacta]ANZ98258.1 glyoxal reductase [Brochothrix thermosphacta]